MVVRHAHFEDKIVSLDIFVEKRSRAFVIAVVFATFSQCGMAKSICGALLAVLIASVGCSERGRGYESSRLTDFSGGQYIKFYLGLR